MTNRPSLPAGAPRDGHRFQNPVPIPGLGMRETLGLMWGMLTAKPATTVPDAPIPVQPIDAAALPCVADGSLFRLGHSTVLLKLAGEFWLTDPVFAERASPLSFAGPRRFHAPPIAIDDLPRLRAVILSHDHYDHLDRAAVVQLASRTDLFIAPLGVGNRLVGWGIDAAKVRQLDWWETAVIGGVTLTAVPARHFSGRTPRDRDRTLWTSWVIDAGAMRVFFSGDTGYHADFRTVGEHHGPFDVTLIEAGGYDKRWPDVHMQPEQTLQAHLDLRGRWLLPVHNSTFDLAFHPWHEPLDRLRSLAAAHGVNLATPVIGARWSMVQPHPGTAWWHGVGSRAP
jgi:L-ascorbate metabolism protein UlaG (beta-lactamase superfamily)